MANETVENILISLKLDLPTSAAQILGLATSVDALKKSTDDLNATSVKSIEEKEATTAAIGRQETAIKKSKDALAAEEGSISSIRKANSDLIKERNNTTVATEAGRAKVADLNKQLDANNKTIKDNVDAYTKQKTGIGDYKGALDKLVPGLGATTDGIGAMTKSAWAFIANPIGAVIGAIGLALGALIAYFKGSEEGQDKLNKIMQVAGAIMGHLMDAVRDVGEAIYNAFTNPKKAVEDLWNLVKDYVIGSFDSLGKILHGIITMDWTEMKDGFKDATDLMKKGMDAVTDSVNSFIDGVIDSTNLAIEQGQKVADMQKNIRQLERDYKKEEATTALEVAKLRERALSEEGEVRRKTIQDAIDMEKALGAKQEELAARKLELAQLEDAIADNTIEDNDKLIQAEVDLTNAKAQRYEATLRFQKEIERLNDQEDAMYQKSIDARAALDKQHLDLEINMTEAAEKKKLAATLNTFDTTAKALAAKLAKEQAIQKTQAEANKKIDDATTKAQTDNLSMVLGTQKINYGEAFKLTKKGALSQLAADQEKAAMAAYQSAAEIPFVGFILGPIAYGAAYVKGAASLAAIAGLSLGFAQGGQIPGISGTKITGSHGIPITRSNGDDLLVTAKRGEVILNERHQAMLGGASTFHRIGVPGFAASGAIGSSIVTRSAISSLDSQNAAQLLLNAINNMPQQILVVQDFEAVSDAKNATAARAKVVS